MIDEFLGDQEREFPDAEGDDTEMRAELIARLVNAGLLRRKRILVGIDSSAKSLAAIGTAVPLAASLGLDLEGLFVEDSDLIRLAQLPFTSEVRYGTEAPMPLDENDLLRRLHHRANVARAAFEEATEKQHVRSSFRVATGWPARLLMEASEEADLVVVGRSGHRVRQRQLGSTAATLLDTSRHPVLLAGEAVDDANDVVAILHKPSVRQIMTDLAQAIAGRSRGVRLIVLGDSPKWLGDDVAEQAGSLTFLVGERHVASATDHPASLLRDYLLTKRASLVLIYDDRGVQSSELLHQLRAVSGWHLLVLRGLIPDKTET